MRRSSGPNNVGRKPTAARTTGRPAGLLPLSLQGAALRYHLFHRLNVAGALEASSRDGGVVCPRRRLGSGLGPASTPAARLGAQHETNTRGGGGAVHDEAGEETFSFKEQMTLAGSYACDSWTSLCPSSSMVASML